MTLIIQIFLVNQKRTVQQVWSISKTNGSNDSVLFYESEMCSLSSVVLFKEWLNLKIQLFLVI